MDTYSLNMHINYLKNFIKQISEPFDYPKRVVEVGVFKGGFAKQFLIKYPQVEEYWGVDPYIPYNKEDGAFMYAHRQSKIPKEIGNPYEWCYVQTSKLMRKHRQFTLLRMKSHEASIFFPDEYLDFVYIDADHGYEEVKRDIICWLPKVRKGGGIAGHDYSKTNYPGVKKAVKEIFGDSFKVIPKGTLWTHPVN